MEKSFLRKLRESKNLKQTDVAIALDVSLSSYRMWEMGVNIPNEENYKKLKKFFEIKDMDGDD